MDETGEYTNPSNPVTGLAGSVHCIAVLMQARVVAQVGPPESRVKSKLRHNAASPAGRFVGSS